MANPEDLGRYRLRRLLGRGALGQVWEADDLAQAGAKVAVKIMHAVDEELAFARTLFARDAQLASLVGQPYMATVHDAGEAAGTSFMVMEWVEGRPLRAALGDPATTDADKLRWLRQVGEALAAMHRVGLVHRDLKPENVIVRPDGTACVVDLGIAKWTRTEALEARDQWRTEPAYVPPEVADGVYDELADQYAWGALGYEMFAGASSAAHGGLLRDHDGVSSEVAEAVDRARSPARSERWGSMERAVAPLSEAGPSGRRSSTEPAAPPSASAAPAGAHADASAEPDASAEIASADEPLATGRSPVVFGLGALALLVLVAVILAALR